jgi:uncharacterized damage-inducible protein DinB
MARNNRWSNYRLLGACAQLSQTDFEAPRSGFFPSIQATLNHILEVDCHYLKPLRQIDQRPEPEGISGPFTSIEPLARAQLAADLELISLCEALDDARLLQSIEWVRPELGRIAESVEDVLLHLFTHQIHHRGQVHAMLSSTRIAPPQLDEFYLEWDLALRQNDLDEMLTQAHSHHADS